MEKVKIGNYVKQIRGVSYKPNDLHNDLNSDSVILLRANNINEGKINFDDIVYVDKSKVKKEQYLKKGDILVCASSGSKELVGKAAFINKDYTVTFGAFCKLIRPKDCIAGYLGHYFNSQMYKEKISSLALGANINNIRNEHIDELLIYLPNKAEQQNISILLDEVSDLTDKRKKQLEKLDELVKPRFIELFGDPVNNSKKLPKLTLPELGEVGRGVSKHRPRNDPQLLGGKYPLIQTSEIAKSDLYITEYESTYSELGFKQSKLWQKGTLCITIAANIAKTAILTFDACFPDSVVGFKANGRTNNIFIHYWFSFFQTILEAQAPESAQKNINLKALSELYVIVPPIELQSQFAAFVKQVDKSKFENKQSLEKLELLKKALMQKYFG